MDSSDLDAVTEAVRQAEARTSGEIVVVIDRAASSYRSVPLVAALVSALLVPWPLIGLTGASAQRIFMIQLIAAAILIPTLLWYGRGGRFMPRFIKHRRAHDVALREFGARGLTRTRARTGILLYVALQERYAEIVADTGISERVEQETWRAILTPLLEAAKAGRLRDGLIGAVAGMGDVLSAHFPAQGDDTDELPNKVVLL